MNTLMDGAHITESQFDAFVNIDPTGYLATYAAQVSSFSPTLTLTLSHTHTNYLSRFHLHTFPFLPFFFLFLFLPLVLSPSLSLSLSRPEHSQDVQRVLLSPFSKVLHAGCYQFLQVFILFNLTCQIVWAISPSARELLVATLTSGAAFLIRVDVRLSKPYLFRFSCYCAVCFYAVYAVLFAF